MTEAAGSPVRRLLASLKAARAASRLPAKTTRPFPLLPGQNHPAPDGFRHGNGLSWPPPSTYRPCVAGPVRFSVSLSPQRGSPEQPLGRQ